MSKRITFTLYFDAMLAPLTGGAERLTSVTVSTTDERILERVKIAVSKGEGFIIGDNAYAPGTVVYLSCKQGDACPSE